MKFLLNRTQTGPRCVFFGSRLSEKLRPSFGGSFFGENLHRHRIRNLFIRRSPASSASSRLRLQRTTNAEDCGGRRTRQREAFVKRKREQTRRWSRRSHTRAHKLDKHKQKDRSVDNERLSERKRERKREQTHKWSRRSHTVATRFHTSTSR